MQSISVLKESRRPQAAYGHLLPQGEKVKSSPSLEVGAPPLLGRLDTFLEVFGGAQPRLLGKFVVGGGEHTVGKPGAHRGAGREQAERRAVSEFLRELHGALANLILR